MITNVITSRIRPQVVRKKTVISVPKTVKVIVKPGSQKVVDLNDVPRIVHTPPAASISKNIASRQRPIHRAARKPQIRTRGPQAGSTQKIKALRHKGRGYILIILGNGPSISEAPLEQLKHPQIHTLAVNKPDHRLWPTTYWAFFDHSQIRRHQELWDAYSGPIFNSTSIRKQKQNSMQFRNGKGLGWSKDPTKNIYIGRSSVYASMQIASWMDYDHVYLLGVDMNPSGLNGQLHFYGTNPDVDPKVRAQRFKKEAEWYNRAAEILDETQRSRFTFATEYNPWDFIKKFSSMSHRDLTPIVEHADSLIAL